MCLEGAGYNIGDVDWNRKTIIALRNLAYSNILKILPPKKWKFSDKNSNIFQISAQKNKTKKKNNKKTTTTKKNKKNKTKKNNNKKTKKQMVRERSRESHNHKPQPFPDTKRKREQTKTKQTQIEQTYEKH